VRAILTEEYPEPGRVVRRRPGAAVANRTSPAGPNSGPYTWWTEERSTA